MNVEQRLTPPESLDLIPVDLIPVEALATMPEPAPMTVLVIEDEAAIGRLVRGQLEQRGMTVVVATTVARARDALRQRFFDLAIVDLTLPDGSGLEIVADLRREGSTAHVIILSGAGSEADRVRALDLGADDYVVKPFFVRELTARVLAVRRRRDSNNDTKLRVGDLEIDLGARQVLMAGDPLPLTAKEFSLLAFLAARPGHVFSRDELLRAVWQSGPDQQHAATVTEHVRRLRMKIEHDPQRPRLLQTVRGLGYRFDLPPDGGATEIVEGLEPVASGTLVHVDGRIVSADEGARALTGHATEVDLVGRHVFELIAPRSLEAARERLRLTDAGHTVRSQVISVQCADGAEMSVELASSPTEWAGQAARRVILTQVTDPSLRLRHLVTGVVSELADAVIVTDLRLHIRSWNRAAARLYGWTEDEVLGRHLLDILQWTVEDEDLAAAWQNLEATGRWFGEGRQVTRDGGSVSVSASTTVVRDERGEPLGIVSINRPVSPTTASLRGRPSADDEREIRRGLDHGEFEVYYQPVVALGDHRIIGFEALIRWNHPDRGLLGPYSFIDSAEQSDLILELGGFLLGQACRQTAAWQQAGADVNLAVNLSAKELGDPGLVDRVMAALAAAELLPSHLWLEVTETALVEDVEQASERLHRLAALGIRISIDDFGTGWASLTYLKEFPVHALKIDRIFVDGVDGHANEVAIVRSILSLGAELRLAVVAEGIETVAQEAALRAMGCEMGQGFLYGKPTPAELVPIHQAQRFGAGHGDFSYERASAGVIDLAPRRRAGLVAGPGAAKADDERTAPDPVAGMLRSLLRIRSAQSAADLLQLTVRRLGATVVPAADASPDALPIDLSLGEGPPLLAEVEPCSVAGMQLERILPRLAEDARQAVDLLRHTERLEAQSNYDKLTGLANRRVLDRVLPRLEHGVVIMMDLDYFKRVNDTLGHAAGDTVLASFGRVLTREVRASDLSCRPGGEEFIVVSADADVASALELIARIRATWAESAPHPVTFSAGVAPVSGAGGTAALLAADRALYQAKELGRDRTEIAPVTIGMEATS